ncbi:YhhN-like_protein [Hexamita inflata]|uniref:YhhN-like protein n=1 Tax=Hexamita inflata TaxID=28002 RepID=A0AA86TYY6_9EUKA|nr:YhhN-like protein [Hexamita inflata]
MCSTILPLQNNTYCVYKFTLSFLFILAHLVHKKTQSKSQLIALIFYGLGDVIITRFLVPAGVVFVIGHIIFIYNNKISVKFSHVVKIVVMSVPVPYFLLYSKDISLFESCQLFVYFCVVASVFVVFRYSQKAKIVQIAAFVFYLSDVALMIQTYKSGLDSATVEYLSYFLLATYYFAVNAYAIM